MTGRSSFAIAVLLGVCGISHAGATTLDFDEFGRSTNFGTIVTHGYSVAATGGDYHFLADGAAFCSSGCPDNGSTYLLSWGATITLSALDESAFSLLLFDAAESALGSTSHWAEALRVTGRRDGKTVADTTFQLDWRTSAEPATANDFETFGVAGFDYLTSLSFAAIGGRTGDFSLDNIVLGPSLPAFDSRLSDSDLIVVATPLPAAGWLFASALLGFAGLDRHRARAAA